jgi:hypothetical protein
MVVRNTGWSIMDPIRFVHQWQFAHRFEGIELQRIGAISLAIKSIIAKNFLQQLIQSR